MVQQNKAICLNFRRNYHLQILDFNVTNKEIFSNVFVMEKPI